jgi:tetratricopeptide (TPR) repeat protein
MRSRSLSLQLGWALAACAFLLAFKQLFDGDLWWHLAAGRWMAENGRVVRADPFSQADAGSPWTSITWGYELLCYALWRLGGVTAITFALSAVAAGATAATWGTFVALGTRAETPGGQTGAPRSGAELAIGALVFAAVLCVIEHRWSDRPEMLAHAYGALMLWLLTRWRLGLAGPRSLLWLPLIELAWVNSHGSFPLGLAIIGAFWAASAVAPAENGETFELARAWRSPLALVFALSGATLLLNPRGLDGALFPIHLLEVLRAPLYARMIPEALNPLREQVWDLEVWSFVLWTAAAGWVLAGLGFARFHRRYSAATILLTAALAWLSLSARRNIALELLWTLPVLADACAGLEAPFQPLGGLPRYAFGALAALAALTVSNLLRPADAQLRFGGGDLPHHFPEGAARFIEDRGLAGERWFNSDAAGNYLLFHLPGFHPYIDSRFAEVYSPRRFEHYMDILGQPRLFAEEAGRRAITGVVLVYTAITRSLISWLGRDPAWVPVFVDETAVVFLRRERAAALRLGPPDFDGETRRNSAADGSAPLPPLIDMLAMLGHEDVAERALKLALARDARGAWAWSALCRVQFLGIERLAGHPGGKVPENAVGTAETTCLKARELNPDDSSPIQTLGLIYFNTGRAREATDAFSEVVRRDPRSFEGELMLGQAWMNRRENPEAPQSAATAFSKASRLRPYEPEPLVRLGDLRVALGDRAGAAPYYERAYQLTGDRALLARSAPSPAPSNAPPESGETAE